MAEKTYLMLDADGIVRNACAWNGVTPYDPPYGLTLVEAGEDEYYEFGQPRGIEPPPPPASLKE
jgi:hypothetical protein